MIDALLRKRRYIKFQARPENSVILMRKVEKRRSKPENDWQQAKLKLAYCHTD